MITTHKIAAGTAESIKRFYEPSWWDDIEVSHRADLGFYVVVHCNRNPPPAFDPRQFCSHVELRGLERVE